MVQRSSQQYTNKTIVQHGAFTPFTSHTQRCVLQCSSGNCHKTPVGKNIATKKCTHCKRWISPYEDRYQCSGDVVEQKSSGSDTKTRCAAGLVCTRCISRTTFQSGKETEFHVIVPPVTVTVTQPNTFHLNILPSV